MRDALDSRGLGNYLQAPLLPLLAANRIVPGEETRLSSYYGKDSIAIGADKRVLGVRIEDDGASDCSTVHYINI
jgi:hypothetical protein